MHSGTPSKLNYLRYRWIRIVIDIQKREYRTPEMKDLVSFMEDVAEEENNPVYGSVSWKGSRESLQNKGDNQRSRGTFSVTMVTDKVVIKSVLCARRSTRCSAVSSLKE